MWNLPHICEGYFYWTRQHSLYFISTGFMVLSLRPKNIPMALGIKSKMNKKERKKKTATYRPL